MNRHILKKIVVSLALLIVPGILAASPSTKGDVVSRIHSTNLDAAKVMLANLKSTDPFVRAGAARTLGDLGNPEAIEPLIGVLNDENLYVRAYTAEALGKFQDSRALHPLIEAMNDEAFFVRAHVVEALGDLGDPMAVQPLVALLEGASDRIKPYVAWALGEIRDTSSVRPLIEALKDKACCDVAAKALKQITHQDFQADYAKWNAWWFTTHERQNVMLRTEPSEKPH